MVAAQKQGLDIGDSREGGSYASKGPDLPEDSLQKRLMRPLRATSHHYHFSRELSLLS